MSTERAQVNPVLEAMRVFDVYPHGSFTSFGSNPPPIEYWVSPGVHLGSWAGAYHGHGDRWSVLHLPASWVEAPADEQRLGAAVAFTAVDQAPAAWPADGRI
ncbi:hypothetical protein [Rhodococcus sp. LB1]|uniref:hypothetical protein n=1 Tax=Rhodococcus sp. LB1 TaxID=1807499 RepID=UPI0012E79D18|nr:hypothetical protein [Rhodococcus sp. LB1]